jgi:hypothetical protein
VFVNVSDPVAQGIIPRLDRPSGNVTGFGLFEASLGGKWLELLSGLLLHRRLTPWSLQRGNLKVSPQ